MKQVISGRVFEQSGPRLTYRRSWRPYIIGCCLALIFAGAGALFAANYLSDRNIYVGGSRHYRGRAIDPGHQTVWQKTRWRDTGGNSVEKSC